MLFWKGKKKKNTTKNYKQFECDREKQRKDLNLFFFLCRFGDHYEWNKVVTCIHNVLSQQRYLEHYGEVTIRNLKSNACTCRITFVKVNQPTSCLVGPSCPLFWVWPDQSLFCWSLVIGAQTPTRTRSRGRFWTRAGTSYTTSEVCGTRASSVTRCRLRSVSGSQVSPSSAPMAVTYTLYCQIAAGRLTILSPHRSTAKGLPPLLRLLHLRHGAEWTHARPEASAAPYRHPPAPRPTVTQKANSLSQAGVCKKTQLSCLRANSPSAPV